MAIDLSGYGSDSNDYENNDSDDSQNDSEEGFYDDRIEDFEEEWKAQSIRRLMDHVAEHFGIDVKGDQGRSEWADIHAECTEIIYGDDGLKDANKVEYDGNLHKYKQQFDTPDYEHDEYNQENADEMLNVEGISKTFSDDYDAIFIPVDFEAPTELYYKAEVDVSAEGIAGQITKSAKNTKGIGNGTLENLEETVGENEELILSLHCVDAMKEAIEQSDELDFEEIVDSVIE